MSPLKLAVGGRQRNFAKYREEMGSAEVWAPHGSVGGLVGQDGEIGSTGSGWPMRSSDSSCLRRTCGVPRGTRISRSSGRACTELILVLSRLFLHAFRVIHSPGGRGEHFARSHNVFVGLGTPIIRPRERIRADLRADLSDVGWASCMHPQPLDLTAVS